jgi:hypothetical protein
MSVRRDRCLRGRVGMTEASHRPAFDVSDHAQR